MHTALRRLGLAGLLLLATGAAPAPNMLVLVRVTGAVQRSGGYQHEADNTHRCVPPLEVPPLPTPGSRFLNTPFTVDFDSDARPPGNSFRLELPFVSPGDSTQVSPDFHVAMTAGGRFWQGNNSTGTGTFTTAQNGRTGSFRITGLHTADSPDTIAVEGTWSCPPSPYFP